MNEVSRADRRAAEATHKVAVRAIRRLDVLGWIILGSAMVLATVGGAGVAWLIEPMTGFGFRPTWTVTSLFLFVVPGVIALTRMRTAERRAHSDTVHTKPENDG